MTASESESDGPVSCTHIAAKRASGSNMCMDCERKALDASIKRAGEALARLEKQRRERV